MGEHRDMTGWQNKGDRTYLLRHALFLFGSDHIVVAGDDEPRRLTVPSRCHGFSFEDRACGLRLDRNKERFLLLGQVLRERCLDAFGSQKDEPICQLVSLC